MKVKAILVFVSVVLGTAHPVCRRPGAYAPGAPDRAFQAGGMGKQAAHLPG